MPATQNIRREAYGDDDEKMWCHVTQKENETQKKLGSIESICIFIVGVNCHFCKGVVFLFISSRTLSAKLFNLQSILLDTFELGG